MLKRGLRLKRSTFPAVGVGARTKSEHFSIVSGTSKSSSGCAVVVSKKVAKKSVDRHLLKRRVQAVMAPFCKKGRFIVVYAKNGSEKLNFQTLKKELVTLLTQIERSMAQ